MMTQEEILELLNREKQLTAGLISNIMQDDAKIIYAEKDGVCIVTKSSNIPMTYALSEQASKKMFELLSDIRCCVCSHRYEVNDLKEKFKNISCSKACWQVVYDKPIKAKQIDGLTIKRLPLEDFYIKFVTKTYSLHFSEQEIKFLMQNYGIYGAFLNDELVGYIGSHEERSIGLLEVMPDKRHLGLGTILLNYMIDLYNKNNLLPYSQIVYGNVKSYNLHVKMGYEISDKLIYWCF